MTWDELEKLDAKILDAFDIVATDRDFDKGLSILHEALDDLPLPWISFCLTTYLMHWHKELLEKPKENNTGKNAKILKWPKGRWNDGRKENH